MPKAWSQMIRISTAGPEHFSTAGPWNTGAVSRSERRSQRPVLKRCWSPRKAGDGLGGTRVEGLEPSTAGFVDRKRRFLPYLVPDSDHPFHTLRREEDSGGVADNRSGGPLGRSSVFPSLRQRCRGAGWIHPVNKIVQGGRLGSSEPVHSYPPPRYSALHLRVRRGRWAVQAS